jgi:hypothetical protein
MCLLEDVSLPTSSNWPRHRGSHIKRELASSSTGMRLLTVEVEAAIAKVNDDARAKSQVASALLLMAG